MAALPGGFLDGGGFVCPPLVIREVGEDRHQAPNYRASTGNRACLDVLQMRVGAADAASYFSPCQSHGLSRCAKLRSRN